MSETTQSLVLQWPPVYDDEYKRDWAETNDRDIAEFDTALDMLDEIEFTEVTDALTDLINEFEHDHFDASVSNFGWRHLNGYKKNITFDDGKDLLRKLLPKTECSFRVFVKRDADDKLVEIIIENAHHDAPTGGEIYRIHPHVPEVTFSVESPHGYYDTENIRDAIRFYYKTIELYTTGQLSFDIVTSRVIERCVYIKKYVDGYPDSEPLRKHIFPDDL